jgi:WD40 repeat protein
VTSDSATQPSPFKGLSPYDEDDARFFFGRDGLREIIIANLQAHRLTVVYGTSGVGKTSVLRAGVAHRLRASARAEFAGGGQRLDVVVIFDAWRDDPIAGILAAIRQAVAELLGPAKQLPPPAGGLVETLRRWTEDLSCDLLILLDQAEEYFLYHAGEDGDRTFAVEFPRVMNAADLPISVLISIRGDMLSRLDRFKSRIPGIDNRLAIQHLDLDAAKAAIQDPLREHNRRFPDGDPWSIEPELVELLLEELPPGRVALGGAGEGGVQVPVGQDQRDQYVETPFLQLVMTRLWNAEAAAGSRVLRADTLRQLGGARSIVRGHLDAAMRALDPDERDLAASIFHYLVTPAGTKIAYSAADLAGYAGPSEAEISRLLERLAHDARLIRPVGPAPDGSGGTRYEVFHDVLAPAILDWRARHAASQAAEKRLRESRARVRRLGALAAVLFTLLVITVVSAASALVQARRAEAQRERATSFSLLAQADARATEQPDLSILLTLAAYRLEPRDLHQAQSRAMLQADRRRDARALLSGPALSRPAVVLDGAAFSPDGRLLAAGDVNGAWVWSVATRQQRFLPDATGRVRSVAFSTDGRLLAGGDSGGVSVWEVATPRRVTVLPVPGGVRSVAFSPDGRLLVAGSADGARLWDARTLRPVATLDRDTGGGDLVAFSGDGGTLASSSSRGAVSRILLWDARRKRARQTLASGEGGTDAIALSHDGRTLVSSGVADGRILIWDLAAGRPRPRVLSEEQSASTVAFSPDGRTVATDGVDSRTVVLWDARRRARIRGMVGNAGAVRAVVFSRDGRTLAATGSDRAVALFDVPDRLPAGHTGFVNTLAFSPDGGTLASGGDDNNVVLWDVEARTPRAILRGHRDQVTGVAFSPDGRMLASASFDGTVALWDVQHARRLDLPAFAASGVFKMAFSPTGPVLALANDDGTLSLWDTRRWVRTAVLAGHTGSVRSLAFSRDGRWLASGADDGQIFVWDVAGRSRSSSWPAHSDTVNRVAFSPDGHALASAGDDGVAIVWDAGRRGIPSRSFPGENVQFSPDGTTLATQRGSEDRIVLTDANGVTTGLLTYGIGIAFSPDGHRLATAGQDVVVHDLDPASWQGRLCALAGRDLTDAEWERFAPGVRKRAICT